jgi:hypothetical protein
MNIKLHTGLFTKKLWVASIGILVACAIAPVTAFAHPSCSSVPGNLVVNCGFETGDFSGWDVAWPPEVDPFTNVGPGFPHSGSYAADLGAVPGENSVSQTIEGTVPGNFYEVSFWLSNDDFAIPNEFHAQWNGQQIFAVTNMLGLPYTRFSFVVVANGFDRLRFDEQQVPAFFHLDDVVVRCLDSVGLSTIRRAPKQAPR